MTSVQEQLKLKRVPIDTWSIKEQLCLASAVLRSGDQNWMSVSRSLKPFGEPSRPADWFSQKSCALQYGNLLENVETPKRKKRTDKTGNEHVETPGESIVRNLTHERINELKRILQEERTTYLKLKEEVTLIKAGQADDRLADMCQQIEEEKKQKEKEAEAHAQWLRDRQEKKLELERTWKPPASSSLRKKLQRRMSGNRRNSSQSEPSSEAESAVDSPLSEQLNVDVIGDETNEAPVVETKPVAPTPTSPLLTSLLKSPSPAPSAQSSILHSAITSAHHRPSTSSPTIASLLNSSPSIPPPTTVSPSLKNLVTSAIGAAANEESPKPVSSSPAAGAPTLSMLLELPPSLPGKPLPELPQPFPSTTTTTKPGEVCHPQHQEMRVRSEPGTDEPVEVVEVEQQVTHEEKVEEAEMKVPTESSQVTPSARATTPKPSHRINRRLFPEVEPAESEEPAAEVAEEAEVKTEEKPEAEMIKYDKQNDKEESPQKSEEPGTEVKKAEDEPESKKQENGLAEEDIKRIMDMPVVMDSEIQEAVATEQTVTEVIEVPAAPAGDLDIFIMDSTSVGNQEEVPVVTDIKLDDDDDDDDNDDEEEEEDEEQNDAKGNEVETKKKAKAVAAEEKTTNVLEGKSSESTVAVANQGCKQENDFDVGESSRIEVVAIEIPSSELESKDADKDISFEDLEKDLYKEEVKKEDENDGKETSQQNKSDENIDEKAGQEALEEKTNKEENVDAEEKDTAIQEEVKEKTETVKDIDVKKDVKDEQEVKDGEEKKSEREEKTSKVETDTESIEDSSKEEQQAKNLKEESVDDLPKIKENKKQEEGKKEVPKEESGEEDEAEGHENDIQATATKEEDKTTVTETAAEQPSEAPGAGNKNWKAEEEEEEEDEEKKEAEKSEFEEAKASTEKQKPASTSLRAETPSTEDDKTNDAVEPARTGTSRKRGTTSTPVDSIPNSPAAPLTDEDREYRTWKKAIMLLYGRLATHKYASLFLRPITDDQAPGYSSIVHRPIDLLTIKKNIETGVTRTTAEFQRDVMLMFLNSIMYNKSSYHVHAMAREMQREGMQHIQDFLTTQMLVQVSEAPLRRETRTTEAHKRGAGPSTSSGGGGGGGVGGGGGGASAMEHLSTPGSSSQEETEASISTPSNKRKRPDHDRNSTSKKRRGTDSSRRHQHTEGDSSKQQTIDKYYKKL